MANLVTYTKTHASSLLCIYIHDDVSSAVTGACPLLVTTEERDLSTVNTSFDIHQQSTNRMPLKHLNTNSCELMQCAASLPLDGNEPFFTMGEKFCETIVDFCSKFGKSP